VCVCVCVFVRCVEREEENEGMVQPRQIVLQGVAV